MRSRRVIVTLELDTCLPIRVLRSHDWRIRYPDNGGSFYPQVEQVSVNVVRKSKPKPGRKGPSND